jgi:DNA repair protein RadA
MPENISDLSLEGLQGVDQHLINKIKGAGIHSIPDLAVTTPSELLEDYYSNYDDDDDSSDSRSNKSSTKRIDIETISQLVIRAKQTLIETGVLQREFSTAEDMLERRKRLIRFTTGSRSFDLFLEGGVETQALTEIAGEFGSGKTQFCYTLCVTANNNISKKGSSDNGVIFVDTEHTFRAERVHQIAESRGLDPEEIMKRVFVCKIYYSAHLEAVIRNLAKSIEQYKAKLVIIDSIISLHRAEFPGRETLAERQQRLNIILHKLVRLAQIYNIAVVYTNQVQAQPDNILGNESGGGGTHFDSMRTAGGNIMGHASTYRIFIRKAGHNSRIATMLDSPYHEYSQVRFTIGEQGIQDLEKKNNDDNRAAAASGSECGW